MARTLLKANEMIHFRPDAGGDPGSPLICKHYGSPRNMMGRFMRSLKAIAPTLNWELSCERDFEVDGYILLIRAGSHAFNYKFGPETRLENLSQAIEEIAEYFHRRELEFSVDVSEADTVVSGEVYVHTNGITGEQTEVRAPARTFLPPVVPKQKRCVNCERPLSPEWKRCPMCGMAKKQEAPKGRTKRIVKKPEEWI